MPSNIAATAVFVYLLLLLVPTVALALFGYLLLVAPVRDKPELRVRRLFMYWLSVGGFFAGGVFWIWGFIGGLDVGLERPRTVSPVPVNPLTGLVFGALFGDVMGRLVWLRLKPVDEEVGS